MRKILESLKRKYGPLPLWAWATIAGGAAALWWRFRGGGAAAEPDAIAQPSYAFGEPDYGDTGAGAAVPPVDEGVYAGGPTAAQVADFMGKVEEFEDVLESQPWLGAQLEPQVEPGGYEIVEPETGEPVERAVGVRWGGRTFTSKAALAKWLQARGAYGSRTVVGAWKEWAKRHPAAAGLLGGPAPRPQPRQAPKPATRPSSRGGSRAAPKRGRGTSGARPRNPRPGSGRPPARPRKAVARGGVKRRAVTRRKPPRRRGSGGTGRPQ